LPETLAMTRPRTATYAALWLALLVLGMPRLAEAGCGCDHPPPAFSPVMPPFGSPGRTVRIYSQTSARFKPGWIYEVTFASKRTYVIAARSDFLSATVPAGLTSGPVALRVRTFGFDQSYAASLFTALPAPPVVPAEDGTYAVQNLQAAVTSDGTLLIPFDVSRILDAKQFALELWNLSLAYGADDVVFYNADGVDLTLFTLAVQDVTQRQWGSYFGWIVEDDTGLASAVYDSQVVVPRNDGLSNLLTYWRHEFHTYRLAHLLGGSHFVDFLGLHPDGTYHVDHDRLVLAIAGKKRTSTGSLEPLPPGPVTVTVALQAVTAGGPIEPGEMVQILEGNPTVRLISASPAPPTSTTTLPRGDDDDDDDDEGNDDDDDDDDDDD
jgi:hypothetical protein